MNSSTACMSGSLMTKIRSNYPAVHIAGCLITVHP